MKWFLDYESGFIYAADLKKKKSSAGVLTYSSRLKASFRLTPVFNQQVLSLLRKQPLLTFLPIRP